MNTSHLEPTAAACNEALLSASMPGLRQKKPNRLGRLGLPDREFMINQTANRTPTELAITVPGTFQAQGWYTWNPVDNTLRVTNTGRVNGRWLFLIGHIT